MKNIDLKLIEKLADKINENSLNEISIEKGDEKITLKKEVKNRPIVYTENHSNKKTASIPNKIEPIENKIIKGNIILAPTVGIFYSAAAPGQAPFVIEGDQVQAGSTVCIIEAMKMMNEVTSSFSGKVVKIFLEDGTVVQKGDKLFVVE